MEPSVELFRRAEVVTHERTYEAFMLLLKWCMVALGSGLLWLTMWFATDAGFLAAFFTGIVVFAVGYIVLLRTKPPEEPGAPQG